METVSLSAANSSAAAVSGATSQQAEGIADRLSCLSSHEMDRQAQIAQLQLSKDVPLYTIDQKHHPVDITVIRSVASSPKSSLSSGQQDLTPACGQRSSLSSARKIILMKRRATSASEPIDSSRFCQAFFFDFTTKPVESDTAKVQPNSPTPDSESVPYSTLENDKTYDCSYKRSRSAFDFFSSSLKPTPELLIGEDEIENLEAAPTSATTDGTDAPFLPSNSFSGVYHMVGGLLFGAVYLWLQAILRSEIWRAALLELGCQINVGHLLTIFGVFMLIFSILLLFMAKSRNYFLVTWSNESKDCKPARHSPVIRRENISV